MWKLRQTWNEVFPIKKMFALDVRVHSIDPAWPITSLPPGTLSEKAIKVKSFFFLKIKKNILILNMIKAY